jgi:hypothetical protein
MQQWLSNTPRTFNENSSWLTVHLRAIQEVTVALAQHTVCCLQSALCSDNGRDLPILNRLRTAPAIEPGPNRRARPLHFDGNFKGAGSKWNVNIISRLKNLRATRLPLHFLKTTHLLSLMFDCIVV